MKKILINLFLFFILFSNIIYTKFNLPYIFQTWDVIFEIILLVVLLYNLKNNLHIQKEYRICYILLIFLVLIGLLGNLIFNYASSYLAIIKDILSFLKFPLTFLILKNMNFDIYLSKNIEEKFFNILKVIIIIISLFGVVSIFKDIGMSIDEYRHGIKPFTFLFSHPTFLVISMIFILALFEYRNDYIKNTIFYELLIAFIILLTMRTKGIAIVAVFLVIKCFGNVLKRFKFLSAFIIFIVILVVGYNKLALYASYTSSSREILYKGSLTLVTKCFPIGSGFGTYASHISGQYMSKVYDFIDIKYVWNTPGNSIAQLGDTGFPYYIGQFGIVGSVILIYLAINIAKLSLRECKNKKAVFLLLIYILIGLTAESTLLNFGSELSIILAIVSSKLDCINKNEKEREKKESE